MSWSGDEEWIRSLLDRAPEPPPGFGGRVETETLANYVRESVAPSLVPRAAQIRDRRGRRYAIAAIVGATALVSAAVAVALQQSFIVHHRSEAIAPATRGLSPMVRSGSFAACEAEDFSVRILDRGGLASESALVLKLDNEGGSVCSLDGYPLLAVTGSPEGEATPRKLVVDQRDHSLYLLQDPGPQSIEVQPGSSVYCAIATNSASGPLGKVQAISIGFSEGGTYTAEIDPSLSASISGSSIIVFATAFQLEKPASISPTGGG